MKFAAIDAALIDRFLAGGFLPTAAVATDNEGFKPPAASKPWARLTNLPTQPSQATLGDGGLDLHTGILQVDLYFPQGKGRAATLQLADQIAAHFKAGESCEFEGQFVRFISCGRSEGRVEDGWYRTVISINWKAHVER